MIHGWFTGRELLSHNNDWHFVLGFSPNFPHKLIGASLALFLVLDYDVICLFVLPDVCIMIFRSECPVRVSEGLFRNSQECVDIFLEELVWQVVPVVNFIYFHYNVGIFEGFSTSRVQWVRFIALSWMVHWHSRWFCCQCIYGIKGIESPSRSVW